MPPPFNFTFRTIEKHLILSIHFTVYCSFSGLYLNINKYIENPNKYCSLIWNVSPAPLLVSSIRDYYQIYCWYFDTCGMRTFSFALDWSTQLARSCQRVRCRLNARSLVPGDGPMGHGNAITSGHRLRYAKGPLFARQLLTSTRARSKRAAPRPRTPFYIDPVRLVRFEVSKR